MPRFGALLRRGSVFLLGLALAACNTVPKIDGSRLGPFYTPKNFQGSETLPISVRRILVLPIASAYPMSDLSLAQLDPLVVKTLNQSRRFECLALSREECGRLTHQRNLLSVDVLPHDFFRRVADLYAVDAVLFVDLTQYHPYPPVAIAIRAKLARVQDQGLLWSFDDQFSTTEVSVMNAARRYWREAQPPGTPVDMSENVAQTPSRFVEYALAAAFATLPPRK